MLFIAKLGLYRGVGGYCTYLDTTDRSCDKLTNELTNYAST